nr:DUF881 domain-containing protein [Peribacillus kribbensis]
MRSKHFVLSLVALVLGFMVAFSYSLTKKNTDRHKLSDQSWDREYSLRKKLVEEEEKTRKLQKELSYRQAEITRVENRFSSSEQNFAAITKEAEKYRMFLGKVKVKGEGVRVTLEDGEYRSDSDVNSYIVHEQHIFKVVNELFISGAEAVAINGQRFTRRSYIVCNGPVITVDGSQHPAPFEITAIGDPDVLEAGLNINGGVKDQLVNENITFSIEKEDELEMNPALGGS